MKNNISNKTNKANPPNNNNNNKSLQQQNKNVAKQTKPTAQRKLSFAAEKNQNSHHTVFRILKALKDLTINVAKDRQERKERDEQFFAGIFNLINVRDKDNEKRDKAIQDELNQFENLLVSPELKKAFDTTSDGIRLYNEQKKVDEDIERSNRRIAKDRDDRNAILKEKSLSHETNKPSVPNDIRKSTQQSICEVLETYPDDTQTQRKKKKKKKNELIDSYIEELEKKFDLGKTPRRLINDWIAGQRLGNMGQPRKFNSEDMARAIKIMEEKKNEKKAIRQDDVLGVVIEATGNKKISPKRLNLAVSSILAASKTVPNADWLTKARYEALSSMFTRIINWICMQTARFASRPGLTKEDAKKNPTNQSLIWNLDGMSGAFTKEARKSKNNETLIFRWGDLKEKTTSRTQTGENGNAYKGFNLYTFLAADGRWHKPFIVYQINGLDEIVKVEDDTACVWLCDSSGEGKKTLLMKEILLYFINVIKEMQMEMVKENGGKFDPKKHRAILGGDGDPSQIKALREIIKGINLNHIEMPKWSCSTSSRANSNDAGTIHKNIKANLKQIARESTDFRRENERRKKSGLSLKQYSPDDGYKKISINELLMKKLKKLGIKGIKKFDLILKGNSRMIRACTKTYDIQSVRRSYENTGLLHRDFREALVDCGQWEKLDKEQKKFIASIVPILQKDFDIHGYSRESKWKSLVGLNNQDLQITDEGRDDQNNVSRFRAVIMTWEEMQKKLQKIEEDKAKNEKEILEKRLEKMKKQKQKQLEEEKKKKDRSANGYCCLVDYLETKQVPKDSDLKDMLLYLGIEKPSNVKWKKQDRLNALLTSQMFKNVSGANSNSNSNSANNNSNMPSPISNTSSTSNVQVPKPEHEPIIHFDDKEKVERAWKINGGVNRNEVVLNPQLHSPSSTGKAMYPMDRQQFMSLKPGRWLTDAVINAYIHVMNNKSMKLNLACFWFNTFFFSQLFGDNNDYCYDNVKRYTKTINLFNFRTIIIPINMSLLHWVEIIVDLEQKDIKFLDSLNNFDSDKAHDMMDIILKYLKEEAEKKRRILTVDMDEFTKTIIRCPQQLDNHSCGVFVLAEGRSFMSVENTIHFDENNLGFDQSHMEYYRYLIGATLINPAQYEPDSIRDVDVIMEDQEDLENSSIINSSKRKRNDGVTGDNTITTTTATTTTTTTTKKTKTDA